MYPNDIIATKHKRKLVMLTAYDYSMAKILSSTSIDMILVGDSLGNVILGYKDTVPVKLDDMIRHANAVVKGAVNKFVIVDMPFMTTTCELNRAFDNVMKVMQETGAQAVKLEGGCFNKELIERLHNSGVPVMGHLGLTPQSYLTLGGYKKQGNNTESVEKIMKDAQYLYQAGVFAIVLECVNSDLAEKITNELPIPIIGIGSGSKTDGQVLVINDLLGITPDQTPSFVKPVLNLTQTINQAVNLYADKVRIDA